MEINDFETDFEIDSEQRARASRGQTKEMERTTFVTRDPPPTIIEKTNCLCTEMHSNALRASSCYPEYNV